MDYNSCPPQLNRSKYMKGLLLKEVHLSEYVFRALKMGICSDSDFEFSQLTNLFYLVYCKMLTQDITLYNALFFNLGNFQVCGLQSPEFLSLWGKSQVKSTLLNVTKVEKHWFDAFL